MLFEHLTKNNPKGEIIMKKFMYKYGHLITSFAFIVTTMSMNKNCTFIYHQAELPETAKRLRNF